MKHYDPNETCPECGSDDILVRFVPIGHESRRWDICYKELEPFLKNWALTRPLMRAVCQRCMYTWLRSPLDETQETGDES